MKISFIWPKFLKNSLNKGQTMVEYVLLIGIMVAISMGVFKQLHEYLVDGDNSFQNQYLKSYKQVFSGYGSSGGQYRYFSIRRSK